MARTGRTNRHCQPGDPEAPCDPTCSASFLDSFANDTFDQNLYWIAAAHGTTRSFPGRGCVDCSNTSFAEWRQLGFDRKRAIDEAAALLAPYDAMLLPTTPAAAPTIEAVGASSAAYASWNLKLLRNTGLVNILDGCAATLPMHQEGEAPVGLMVAGMGGSDARVLAVASAVEGVLGGPSARL